MLDQTPQPRFAGAHHDSTAPTEVMAPLNLEHADPVDRRPAAVDPSGGLPTPSHLGKYEILDCIGRGAFAVVYKGYDPSKKRLVAIKVCDRADPDTRARMRREAAIGRRLAHRNLMEILDFGSHGSDLYLVLEYLPGEDLADLIRRRQPLSMAEKLALLLQVSSGLTRAHSVGILHRDIKPANIRLKDDGQVKIMDFGSAKRPGYDSSLTALGSIIGTVAYMSPQCLRGEPEEASSDIYSFGVLAYELLTYRLPFYAHRILGLIQQILAGSPPPLAIVRPDYPTELAEIVHKCLNREPQDRFQSFADLHAELSSIPGGPAG